MHCSFLLKLASDPEFTYYCLEGCEGGQQNLAALHFWIGRHADLGITAGNFKQKVKEHKLDVEVWARYPHMVSIVDAQFFVKLVEVPNRKGQYTLIAQPGMIKMKAGKQFHED